MTDHDGILTLLNLPDPVEKKLALRSKAVQPYHLRIAMQDSDPQVRALAVAHPKMTEQLLSEILSGSDDHLKHVALQRRDLTPEHLALVATDPTFAHTVANHPKTTDAIREMAIRHHAVPEGVKAFHEHKLFKNIGFITYPQLGEGRVYTRPMHLSREQAKIRSTYTGTGEVGEGLTSGNYGETDDAPVPPHHRVLLSLVAPQPNAKQANEVDDHEAQHSVFMRIGQKHGHNAQLRTVATTLSRLEPHHRAHIHRLFSGHPDSKVLSITDAPEESIAYLQSYLQNPRYRDAIHSRLGMYRLEDQQQSVQTARKAWKSLQRIASSLRPEEVGIDLNPEDRIGKWVKQLKKRESIPSDQLGFSVSFFEMIAICEFLTQRSVDPQVIRQFVRQADGDGQSGVLAAFGLNTPQGKKAFESVKALKLHKAEDILAQPKQIVGLDREDVAALVQEAYDEGKVNPVSLGGKHSSGSYIAEDSEGNSWLLKPGSGKKSPAAGVDETAGSQSRREAVFSVIARWMGIEEVQPAGLLQVDGREVAAIKMWPLDWVNLHRATSQSPNLSTAALEPYRQKGLIFKWAVLDFVAGNADRHGNNLMVGPEDEGNKIGLIDHGSSMAGPSFDPGNDKDSFVPYYLRVWCKDNFHALPHDKQLNQMPTLSGDADQALREWIDGMDPDELASIISRYGMDPGPAVQRLLEVQSDPMAENMSRHICSLWLESPQSSSSD